MTALLSLFAFIVATGILVSVHEYGHFWVARRCGVKVHTFSIGFGRTLFSWQKGETEWRIAMIPLGGFVGMLDEREGTVHPSERHRAFNRASVWRRIAIVSAGPLANFLLAFFIYWAVFLHGIDVIHPRIGLVLPESPAQQAGLRAGDVIQKIDGDVIHSWQDVRMALVDQGAARARIEIEIERPGGGISTRDLDLSHLKNEQIDGDIPSHLGMYLPSYLPILGEISPTGVAATAGLRRGDVIKSIDGKPITNWITFATTVHARPDMPTNLVLMRGTQMLNVTVTPRAVTEDGKTVGKIGVAREPESLSFRESLRKATSFGLIGAAAEAARHTWNNAAITIKMLARMVIGQVSIKQISGPVTMASYAGQSAQQGLQTYLIYLCVISVGLGVLNLLPIPVLDGGHLLYYSAELLTGKPVPDHVTELGQRIGLSVLVTLMAIALFNDLSHVFVR